MAGPFDLITNALGQQNPYDEARDYQARQNAANQAALPNPDGSTTPVPGPNGGPIGPGGPQNAPGAKGPTPAQTQPASQQPNSTKTPEDLGSIMLDLQQYNERNQGFNQALGMGVAALAQPRDRQMVSQMFNTQLGDPTKIGQFLMNANSQQQGQNRMNALGQLISGPQGDAIAKQLNMGSAAQLRAAFLADPQSVAKMIETTQQPTPQVANIDQITRYMDGVQQRSPNSSPEVLTLIKNSMLAGMAGPDAEKAVGDAMAYKAKNGKDAPWIHNGVVDQAAYGQFVANQKDLNDSVNAARDVHGKNIAQVTDMNNRVNDIQNSPALTGLLNSSGLKKTAAKSLLNTDPLTPINAALQSINIPGVTFSPQELAVIDNIRQLKGQEYATAMHNLSMSRPAAAEVQGIQNGLGQIQNLDMDPDTYKSQALEPMDDMLKTVRANSYGSSQNFNDMPEDLRSHVDPQYLKGGTRNLEGSGSEDWADQVKATDDEQKQAEAMVAKGQSRAAVGRWFRSHGVRLTGF
jgi:hypothetical protein